MKERVKPARRLAQSRRSARPSSRLSTIWLSRRVRRWAPTSCSPLMPVGGAWERRSSSC